MLKQPVIPVLRDMAAVKHFLKREETWCILMDFHINLLEDIIKQLHQHAKKALVHMDLMKGIQNDLYGVQFLTQYYHVDGIISTKPSAIEAAKKNHCISVLRVFLIDSRSIEKSGRLAEKLEPDYVEVLPAIIPFAVEKIRQYTQVDIIGGGLIQSVEDIKACLAQGMVGVSTSQLTLCDEWRSNI